MQTTADPEANRLRYDGKGRGIGPPSIWELDALWAWTAKEAVQKAARLGMHLNPRDVVVSNQRKKMKYQLKFDFQLENLPNDAYQITLAWGLDSQPIRTPEDDLLDATRTAMNSGEDWTVGCSTVRTMDDYLFQNRLDSQSRPRRMPISVRIT